MREQLLRPGPRVWAYSEPVDLRKGMRRLQGLVERALERDPMSGDLFVFESRDRKLCKVFYWDGSGLCVFMKRLDRGCFAPLWRDGGPQVELSQSELQLFLDGCQEVGYRSLLPHQKPRISS